MRRLRHAIIAAGLFGAGWMSSGCDDPAPQPPRGQRPTNAVVEPPPTQHQAVEEPATQQPLVLPTEDLPPDDRSMMSINGRLYDFPPARLTLRVRDDRSSGMLFSLDPREAINANYKGNSFYLPFETDAIRLADLYNALILFRGGSGERTDSQIGIFLSGDDFRLAPINAEMRVEPTSNPEQAVLTLAGMFRVTDTRDPSAVPYDVILTARLLAEVKTR